MPISNDGGIWQNAFSTCYNLKTVEFAPDSTVGVIGSNSFGNCISLTEVKMPKKLYYIFKNAFTNCESLERLEIPSMTEFQVDYDKATIAGYMYENGEYIKADGVQSAKIPYLNYGIREDGELYFVTGRLLHKKHGF